MADRKRISAQERKQRQAAARRANAERKRRRGVVLVATIGLVAILFVFGVLGQNLRGDGGDNNNTATTNAVGQVRCPREDGTSPRQVFFSHAPGRCIDGTRTYRAVIKTSAGTITADLDPSYAFNAVNNFVFLARYHFYDGLSFHRVLKDTFIQTGDPTAPGVTGPGYEFPDDGLPPSSAAYVPGAILYAHESANTNGSQILIISGPGGTSLNPTFPLFGQVIRGMDVVTKINSGASDTTATPRVRYSVLSIDVTARKR